VSPAYESTTVPVERSQGEIRKLLAKHGASRFEFGEAVDEQGTSWAAIAFALGGRSVRMRVPLKPVDRAAIRRKLTRTRTRTERDLELEAQDQEARRIWRVLAWNLKARLEAVEEGVETFDEAFLAHLLDEQTGETIYEQLARTGSVELASPLTPALPMTTSGGRP
jgi:hypothetical protein